MLGALGSCQWVQSTQVAQPRVVVLDDIAMKDFESAARWVRNRPCSMHKTQHHIDGTGVSMSPFLKRWQLAVLFPRAPILPAQEPRHVPRANGFDRQSITVAVIQQLTYTSRIPPLDP